MDSSISFLWKGEPWKPRKDRKRGKRIYPAMRCPSTRKSRQIGGLLHILPLRIHQWSIGQISYQHTQVCQYLRLLFHQTFFYCRGGGFTSEGKKAFDQNLLDMLMVGRQWELKIMLVSSLVVGFENMNSWFSSQFLLIYSARLIFISRTMPLYLDSKLFPRCIPSITHGRGFPHRYILGRILSFFMKAIHFVLHFTGSGSVLNLSWCMLQ